MLLKPAFDVDIKFVEFTELVNQINSFFVLLLADQDAFKTT
jgi:hypothetical protein